jgi:hypothetical protein
MQPVHKPITAALILTAAILLSSSYKSNLFAAAPKPPERLFPKEVSSLRWLEFKASGFRQPVSGVIFHSTEPPCCGMPLGGIATGCIDLDARGAFGFNALFNILYREKAFSGQPGNVFLTELTRKLPDYPPFLGLSIGDSTWVLSDKSLLAGGKMETCVDPVFIARKDHVTLPPVEGVRCVSQIDYWGHYPVADLE